MDINPLILVLNRLHANVPFLSLLGILKTFGFLVFSEEIKREHWTEMG